jgi:hypothetical protein
MAPSLVGGAILFLRLIGKYKFLWTNVSTGPMSLSYPPNRLASA